MADHNVYMLQTTAVSRALRRFIDEANEGFCELNQDLFIVDTNPGLSLSLGYNAPDDIKGKSFLSFAKAAPVSDVNDLEKTLRRRMAGDDLTNSPQNITLRRQGGDTFPASITTIIIYDSEAFQWHLYCWVKDLSANDAILDALQDPGLFEYLQTTTPIRVIRKSSDGVFVDVNNRFCEEVNLSREDIIGRRDEFFFGSLAVPYRADDQVVLHSNRVFQAIEQHVIKSGGISHNIYVHVVKSRYIDVDGSVQIQVVYWPMNDREAVLASIVKAKDSYHQSILDQIPLSVYRKDGSLRFTYANRSFLQHFGMRRKQVIGKTDRDLFPSELAVQYEEADRKVIETGLPHEGDEEHVPFRGDSAFGQRQYIHVVKTAVQLATDFPPSGIQGVFWDVTPARLAIERERRAMEKLDYNELIFREMNHRVADTLSVLASLVRLQMNQHRGQAPFAILQDTWNRIWTMKEIHSLLSRSDEARLVELVAFVRQLCQAIHSTIASAGVVLNVVGSDDIIVSDSRAISAGMVVSELVANALMHAFPAAAQGQILVRLSLLKGEVAISVKDDGCGMRSLTGGVPSDYGPDAQLHSRMPRERLGLKLVREMVERELRGTFEISSMLKGVAARIVFNRIPEDLQGDDNLVWKIS